MSSVCEAYCAQSSRRRGDAESPLAGENLSVRAAGRSAAELRWLGEDPLSGDWFVFRNRRGDRLKILMWDRDGLLLVYKRLEEGTFRFPVLAANAKSVLVTTQELSLLLWGIDPASVVRQKRYVRPSRETSQPGSPAAR
jgi:transposase